MRRQRSSDRVNARALDYPGSVSAAYIGPPIRVSYSLREARVDTPYRVEPVIQGPIRELRYSISGLPIGSGLVLDASTGVLAGYPARPFHATGILIVIEDLGSGATEVIRDLTLDSYAKEWMPLAPAFMLGLPGQITRDPFRVPPVTTFMLGLPGVASRGETDG